MLYLYTLFTLCLLLYLLIKVTAPNILLSTKYFTYILFIYLILIILPYVHMLYLYILIESRLVLMLEFIFTLYRLWLYVFCHPSDISLFPLENKDQWIDCKNVYPTLVLEKLKWVKWTDHSTKNSLLSLWSLQ